MENFLFQPISTDTIVEHGQYLFYDRSNDVRAMLREEGLPTDAVDFILDNNPNGTAYGYHNNQHIFDVALKTRDIAHAEQVDDTTHVHAVILAALFHDIGYQAGEHPDSENIQEATRLWDEYMYGQHGAYVHPQYNNILRHLVREYIKVTEFPHQENTPKYLNPTLVGAIRDADLLSSTHSPDRLSFLAGLKYESNKYAGCNPEFPPVEWLHTETGKEAHRRYLNNNPGQHIPHGGARIMSNIIGVGYEGVSIDDFTQALQNLNVTTLVDVRLNPISRKPGFSKKQLQSAVTAAGIKYEHLRALGNPKDNRAGFYSTDPAEKATASSRYHKILEQESGKAALARIRELAQDGTVALLCFECDDGKCHRRVILQALARGE